MARTSAHGTEFYRLDDGSGPYSNLVAAKIARTNFNRQANWHGREYSAKIQKLEAICHMDGFDCVSTLEWVDVDE